MLCAILVLVVSGVFAQAQPTPGENTEAARATEAAAAAKRAAEAYRVTTREAGTDALRLEPKSLLTWSNPVLGSFHGSVFLWTANGRPEVVASIYKKYVPLPLHLGIEFHSLTEGPATADRDGHADWSPDRGGVKFRPVPGAPAPPPRPPGGSGRCAPWQEISPPRRQIGKPSAARCGCSPSRSTAMKTPTIAAPCSPSSRGRIRRSSF